MNSFSQAQIARKYNITRATVGRWVEQAIQDKNSLQVEMVNKKVRVLDNPHNDAVLATLSSSAQKYKSHVFAKETTVESIFYDLYDEEERVEIFNDLQYKKQIKHKFVYKKPQYWDNFYKLGISPVSKANSELSENAINNYFYLLPEKTKINVIDIGPGNGYPVKNLLTQLQKQNRFGRYVGIDISSGMLRIDEQNLRAWFPDLDMKFFARDAENARFGKIFLDNKSLSETEEAQNLILYINGLCNSDDAAQMLNNFRSGMTSQDLLAVGFTVDRAEGRGQLNYIKDAESTLRDGWHLQAMGIDIFECETAVEFDLKHVRKNKVYILDKDYVINYELSGFKKVLRLKLGERISTWRHYLLTTEEFMSIAKQAELEVVNLQLDKTSSYGLAICKVSES